MREMDYRVMRNPRTLASYRSWLADSARIGRPFTIIGGVCLIVGGLIEGLMLRQMGSAVLKAGAVLVFIGAIALGVGLWRVWRHRSRQPWVDPQA